MKSNKKFLIAALGLMMPLAAWAGTASTGSKVYHGVQLGAPVTPVSLNVDLRNLPVVPAWHPGMAIHEAHKRQFYPPKHVSPAAPASVHAKPDYLPDLQRIWDQHAPAVRSLRADANHVSINNGSTGVSPGDPVIDVSPNYLVYGVNSNSGTTFTVYDKTGTKLAGPTAFSSLAPTGDGCKSSVSDPIVLFDRLAGRWFLLEMGGSSSAPKMCVYVSKSENPVSGGWWFYGFATPTLNDYPHCGVWNNAYVCTDNEGDANVTAYAYDRANMLLGSTARAQQRFVSVPALAGYGFQALTPATYVGDSAHAPPAGTQQILARHDDDEAHAGTSADPSHDFIDLFSMNVDWTTPANSSITALPRVQITEFNSWFHDYSTFATVPQPGSSFMLDPIREVILNSLVYRNLGSYESIVGQFATNVNPARSGSTVNAGVRWFELRRVGGASWTLQQEGTFSPGDASTHHLLGSIATDNKGNIALGYNVTRTTSPVTYATLGYTGRLAADPAGVMTQGENTVAAGSAVETSGRWGDYYSMVVDPTDDCTFWMVGMYRPSGGWNTRIADFKFNDCGPVTTTYSVSGIITTDAGARISGVTISTGSVSTTTTSSGTFTLNNLANATYTLTPSAPGYSFSPVSRSVSVSGANVTGQDFTGTATTPNNVLTNGVAVTGIAGAMGSDQLWTLAVPVGATGLKFVTNGGTGNADLYVKFGSAPTTTVNDCKSEGSTTAETCSIATAQAGKYFVLVHGHASFSGVSLTGSYTTSGGACGGAVLCSGTAVALPSNTRGGVSPNFTLEVPAGKASVVITISGGKGDADLYVNRGFKPTLTDYVCRPYLTGTSETCTLNAPAAGTYYINVRANTSYSGVSLTGTIN